jgi:hypothetical protein
MGHNFPTPTLSSLTSPPGRNSANGRATKAYFSPLKESGILMGVRTSKKDGPVMPPAIVERYLKIEEINQSETH